MARVDDSQDFGLTVQTRRARRIPKADLRERVLAKGSVLLEEAGVTASLYHVNMEELIRRVGVPRSSVFAAFGGKEELITELMVRLLVPGADKVNGYSPGTAMAAHGVIEKYGHLLRHPDGSRDLEGEHAVMREAVRVVASFNADEFVTSNEWHTFMALAASVDSLPEGRRERVVEALREADAIFTAAMVEFYGAALTAVGRRMRPGLEWRHLVSAGAGMVEGIVARRRFGASVANETFLQPGIDGDPVEWTLVAVAYLAMLENLTEPIPL